MYQNILWIEDFGIPCIRKAQVSKFINPPTAFEHVFWQISPQDLSESAWQNSHIIKFYSQLPGMDDRTPCMQLSQGTVVPCI